MAHVTVIVCILDCDFPPFIASVIRDPSSSSDHCDEVVPGSMIGPIHAFRLTGISSESTGMTSPLSVPCQWREFDSNEERDGENEGYETKAKPRIK